MFDISHRCQAAGSVLMNHYQLLEWEGGEAGLTITSLMDAMTIILCFLLKSYSVDDVTVSADEDLKLPARPFCPDC